MIKTKKSKKTRIGLILCSLFICLCSILCIVPFKQEKIQVSADSVTTSGFTFNGSELYYPCTYSFTNASTPITNLPNSNNTILSSVVLSRVAYSFTVDNNGYLYSIKVSGAVLGYSDEIYNFSQSYLISDLTFLSSTNSNWYYSYIPIIFYTNNGTSLYLHFEFTYRLSDVVTIDNVNYLSFGQPISFTYYTGSDRGVNCNKLFYYDSSNHYIAFRSYFLKFGNPDSYYNTSSRTYYFQSDLNLSDNEYYQQGYETGRQNGYNTGYNAGETAGYNEGYNLGQTTGYNNGYSAGMEDSNQYTFLNLLSSTIDAPVKYFQSLFNFEILGVNLQSFLTGLFTLCIIVTIIKLCLGK